jgi:hypothetical protein
MLTVVMKEILVGVAIVVEDVMLLFLRELLAVVVKQWLERELSLTPRRHQWLDVLQGYGIREQLIPVGALKALLDLGHAIRGN